MTKEELIALRQKMEDAARTVEQMGMADTSRWTVEQRVEMDLEYNRAKRAADEARDAYRCALSGHAITQPIAGRILH